jgi:hypothetical protein
LGSVADAVRDHLPMPEALSIVLVFVVCVALGATLARLRGHSPTPRALCRGALPPMAADIARGTVRTVTGPITVDVESVTGQRFVGRLHGPAAAGLRPGVVLLVTFDPDARERLSLADDITAVRSAFDQMLVRKGLVTSAALELIRHGTRAHGVVTAMRATGGAREDYREVELDLMVSRPGGGQFPAHETTLVPMSALGEVGPGSIVDAYYRHGDESVVAVCVPPV